MPATQMKTIEIPADLYSRLSSHAVGFDTPASVIERLLNNAGKPSAAEPVKLDRHDFMSRITTAEIVYFPNNNEAEFKRNFLEKKRAFVGLVFFGLDPRICEWNLQRFSETASVRGNLFTGYLRGWRERGIYKSFVSTERDDVEKAIQKAAELGPVLPAR
jgi:hypothetical protein